MGLLFVDQVDITNQCTKIQRKIEKNVLAWAEWKRVRLVMHAYLTVIFEWTGSLAIGRPI